MSYNSRMFSSNAVVHFSDSCILEKACQQYHETIPSLLVHGMDRFPIEIANILAKRPIPITTFIEEG